MANKSFPAMTPGVAMGFLPWNPEVAKTADYQVLARDNGTPFTNRGATGSVTFTLPKIAANYRFLFRVVADQAVTVASKEGSNVVAMNNAAASSVAFSTGGQQIGGCVVVQSSQDGTLWYVENASAGTNTITVA